VPAGAQRGTGGALIELIRHRWSLIAVCTLLLATAGYVTEASKDEEFESTASLVVRPAAAENALYETPDTDEYRATLTTVELGGLNEVSARTARRMRDAGLSAAEVDAAVSVSSEGNSAIVDVVATAPRPQLAADLANTYAREYIAVRRDLDRRQVRDARTEIQRTISQLTPEQRRRPRGRRLLAQRDQLDVLLAVRTGNLQLVQPARPNPQAVGPEPDKRAVLGGLAGLVLGLAIAMLLEQRDRRMKDEEDLDEAFGLPILGRVIGGAEFGSTLDFLAGPPGEAFRMLRANLRALDGRRRHRSLLVCSAVPEEGRTFVAWGLAFAEARTGARVLLVEADMRNPVLASRLGIHGASGLSTVLSGECELFDPALSIAIADVTIEIIPAGPIPPNPSELLGSPRMAEVLAAAEDDYDLVILDSPPLALVADATPLLSQVGGVVAVARLGLTTAELVSDLLARFEQARARVLGVVINAGRGERAQRVAYEEYDRSRRAGRRGLARSLRSR
jgi:capsular exopolysaccharide synthesis family protein